MKMIKIISGFNKGKSMTYPLRIDKQGRVNLLVSFLKNRGLENIKYAVPFISEDTKQIEMIVSPQEIEPDNFRINRNKSHINDMNFQSKHLHKVLNNDILVYYEFKNMDDTSYNGKKIVKIRFTREDGSSSATGGPGGQITSSIKRGKEKKVQNEVDLEISKEGKHRGRPRKNIFGRTQPLNLIPQSTQDKIDREIANENPPQAEETRGRPGGAFKHQSAAGGSQVVPSGDEAPVTANKKTSAVNNTDFPSMRGRQPWIRCIGCGTFQKKFKKDMYWEFENAEYHIGLCSNCGGSDVKHEIYYAKIKELESKPA